MSNFKQRLQGSSAVLAPGIYDALTALVAEQAGFEALYLSGASIAYTRLARSDVGLTTATEVEDTLARITDRVSLPVIVDADTGFGNAVNVTHTVRTLEQAGASAVQLEDQHAPKRCGHFSGKELIPLEEMLGKVRAAVDTRRQNLVVIARTDACAVEGFEAAITRASSYIEAGADVTFVEAPETLEDLQAVPRRLKAPQLVNMVLGGKTPIIDQGAAADMGFSLVLYANAALQGAVHGMQTTLSALKKNGVLAEDAVTSFAERQRLVGKPAFDALEARYAVPAAKPTA